VAVLVSDRHDNIGMDPVVRKVADEAGATAVIDAGDDTSTGEPWEEFSLESMDTSFEGFDQVFIEGNHDNGSFVKRHLSSLGWTHLDAKAVKPFAGVRMTGVDDPRSSGLGSWLDEKGLSYDEVRQRLADDVCALDAKGERIATVVVHAASLAKTALERGCTDLVVAGHIHSQLGPTRVVGENGKAGYTYTNGTTGGAAYAIAIGSKLRRDAEFTFITYRGGRPVGIQPVTVKTTGVLSVAPYLSFHF
jgi:predicted phosphodiesterase